MTNASRELLSQIIAAFGGVAIVVIIAITFTMTSKDYSRTTTIQKLYKVNLECRQTASAVGRNADNVCGPVPRNFQ